MGEAATLAEHFWSFISDPQNAEPPLATASAIGAISLAFLLFAPSVLDREITSRYHDKERARRRVKMSLWFLGILTEGFLLAALAALGGLSTGLAWLSVAAWLLLISSLVCAIIAIAFMIPAVVDSP